MNDVIYVIDNNALSKIDSEQRKGDYFQNYCRIPTEVLYEARWADDLNELENVEYPITVDFLETLKAVMDSLPVTDTSLIDLYANEGNADPMVVAVALMGQRVLQPTLFEPEWKVVSNDKAVRAKAEEFGIRVLSSEEFLTVLETAQNAN